MPCHAVCTLPPCSPWQVQVAAVRAIGNFACKGTAFRNAVIEAGAVDKLVQVRTAYARSLRGARW